MANKSGVLLLTMLAFVALSVAQSPASPPTSIASPPTIVASPSPVEGDEALPPSAPVQPPTIIPSPDATAPWAPEMPPTTTTSPEPASPAPSIAEAPASPPAPESGAFVHRGSLSVLVVFAGSVLLV